MICSAFVKLSDCPSGTTWDGMPDCSMDDTIEGGTEFFYPLVEISMEFRDELGTIGLTLSSEEDEITIDDANEWKFSVMPVLSMDLDPGIWSWNIRTTDGGGRIKQYVEGNMQIT